MQQPNHKTNSGFTLAELSVVLIIIALIVGMTTASGVTVISAARYSSTVSKMAALDRTLMAFRIANDRIPCPADLSQTQGSATYGTEGSCAAIAGGVFVATNAGATATAAEGGVPTVALGLPNDFMYDGWGNRFRYAVDTKMTSINAFSLMQAGCVNGAITVYGGPSYPATGNTARSTAAIYAIVSHGANGHGGVTKNAVVTDAGSLNSDEQTNCHCTSTGAAGTYAPTYVQLAPYTYQAIGQANSHYNFDDIVSYQERWQMQTRWDRVGTNCAGGAVSRAITINYSYVSTVNHTNLTSFPMLFSGTYSYLATIVNGGNVANANGYDITFTSDAAGNDLLPFERENYNATTGAVNFWVQVPTVSAAASTTIYLWYDNPDITTDPSNKNGTWDSNYKAVWHLGETSGSPQDSTSYANSLTKLGTVTQGVVGVFGNAAEFNGNTSGTNYFNMANPGDGHLNFGTGAFTISSWVNLGTAWPANSAYFDILYYGSNTTNAGYSLFFQAGGTSPNFGGAISDSSHNQSTSNEPTVTKNTWYHLVQVVIPNGASSQQNLYLNGTEYNGNKTESPIVGNTNSTQSLQIGAASGSSPSVTNTLVQEVHIVNGAESADWIVTEYNNQSSPSTFYTVGSAVSR